MISRTGRIQKLSPLLVNQIAAGEVIERPASVIKELIENSIDAGAVQLVIELEEGGKRLIRVTDDGCGIDPDDLPLAIDSHATSKLLHESDLHCIRTLGFRGEAIASIASVAELEIMSRPLAAEMPAGIRSYAGETEPVAPVAMPQGTKITVRNLFSAVPARRRFLKSVRAELSRITTQIQRVAMSLPNLGIDLVHDGKRVLHYPKGQSEGERLQEVLGEKVFAHLVPLERQPGIWGWIGKPDYSRRNAEGIHTFLNGRFLKDRVVLHAVKEAYRGYQIPGHNPIAVLFLNVEPAEVDVNVHPAKLEVRFRDSSAIHSMVFRSCRSKLEGIGSVPSLMPSGRTQIDAARGRSPLGAALSAPIEPLPPRPWDGLRGERHFGSSPLSSDDSAGLLGTDPRELAEVVRDHSSEGDRDHPSANASDEGEGVGRVIAGARELVDGRELRVFQVHNAYLVLEEPDGLTVIDQHALHEKILYEEFCESRQRGELRQPLLMPETVELSADEWEHWDRCNETLQELGFEAEEFGDRTIIVRGVPAGYEKLAVAPFIKDVIGRWLEVRKHGGDSPVELRQHLVATLACKAAVKAGQRLSSQQQLDLVRGRSRAFQPQNCPHGRPSELFLSWQELERRFDRK